MEIDPNNLQKLVQRQIFVDPSDGSINLRIMLALFQIATHCDFDEKQRKEIFDLLTVTSLKLCGVWNHKARYEKLEDELIAEAYANPIDEAQNKPVRLHTAQNLYLELDGLLVQFKSTLDHMVHILHFGFGIGFASLTTFGEKGKTIIKMLSGNVAAKDKIPGRQLSKYIDDNQEWLTQVIDLRDRLNHYKSGGIGLDNFTVFVRKLDGKDVLYVPKLSDEQTVRELMTRLFWDLLGFVEHFMAFGMLPKLSKYVLHYKEHPGKPIPRWSILPKSVIDGMDPAHIKPMPQL